MNDPLAWAVILAVFLCACIIPLIRRVTKPEPCAECGLPGKYNQIETVPPYEWRWFCARHTRPSVEDALF